jgi:type I restriction enzyme S subunit
VKETANRWVAIRDLSRRVVCETAERITALGVNNSNAKLQQEGTVLLSFKLSIGRVAFAGCDLYTNEAIAGLRSEVLSSEFLYYGLQQWDLLQNVDQAIKGATLNKDKLKKIEFDYPQSDREQAKIAEVLSALDHAIEQTEELMAKQQSIKTGLMQGLLTKGIDEHGKIRCETTHAFKDSPLGRIPVEWDVQELKSLLADVDPAMRSGPFGSALLKEELAEVGIPLLGIDNVFPEKFVSDYKRFVPPKKAQQLRRYLVRSHDLMITIMGTVGRCCVVPDDIGEALSSKHVWTVSLDQTKYSPYVACLQINSAPWVLEHFAKDEQGGIMSSIRAETLRTMRLPVPPRSELEKIENVLRSISADLVEKKLLSEKLISLKVGLMRDLLTGERRVISLLAQVAAQ